MDSEQGLSTYQSTIANKPSVEFSDKPPRTIEQIKQTLLDPRAISKKFDQRGREEKALQIEGERQISRTLHGNINEKEALTAQIEQQATALTGLRGEKNLALIERMSSTLVRAKNLLRIKDRPAADLEAEVISLDTEIDSLTAQSLEAKVELSNLQQQEADLPDPKETLKAYYEKMSTVPLTNKEKREYLKPEILAELSTEEYIALWRRLNPYFLSHVTRQGFRDHNAMVYHSAGLQEFHNGFVGILEDEKILHSPIAVRDGLRARDDESVKRFLEDWALKAENEEEAKKRLNAQLNHTLASAPGYPDKSAVHFAAQIVADGYYGGEKNNEAFFIYPSDILASQHNFAFNGWGKDLTHPQSETKWNDVFVWPSTLNNPGIPVDAGMVFLSQNTPVDPETGSKYASEIKTIDGEEKRVMIEDEKLVTAFVGWAENLNNESPAIRAYKEYDKRGNESWYNRQDSEKTCYDVFRSEIIKLGFPEEAAMDITHNLFSSMDGINEFQDTGAIGFGDSKKEAALNKLRSANANWKRAENAIPAKEYWERYFTKNPKQKPKHLVYYDGDPTTAVYRFQQKNNIGRADTSGTNGQLLGFSDNHVLDMEKDLRSNPGYDGLVATANKIITAHYSNR